MEALSIDFTQLLSILGHTPEKNHFESLGIIQRMKEAARSLLENEHDIDSLSKHPSDTVRGWAGYMISFDSRIPLKQKFTLIENLADDQHFGVREWAWLAMRPSRKQKTKDDLSVKSPALAAFGALTSPFLRNNPNSLCQF